MRIGVYAISKNEAKNIARWLEAVREADAVCVTDTGSTDDSRNLFERGGAKVSSFDKPFRFDEARNFALEKAKATGADILVSLDIDEVPEAGWRDRLEWAVMLMNDDVTGWRIRIDNGSYSFVNTRVHRREGWHWEHACHEILCGEGRTGPEVFTVKHYQDSSKRRDYLPLLLLDARERPEDGRAWHYLGREYMYQQRWQEAIDALNKAVEYDAWDEQRAASYRFISRCKWRLRQYGGAKEASYKAAQVYPGREEWVDLAWLLDWLRDPAAKEAAKKAMEVTTPGLYPAEGSAWGPLAESIYKKWAEA